MRVEIGLFEEDNLLFQGEIKVKENEFQEENEIIKLKHQLINDEENIEVQIFNNEEEVTKSTLYMPVHESEDWESIKLVNFTLAFKCKLNA